jgi:hypothetical protein
VISAERTHEISAERTHETVISAERTREISAERTHAGRKERTHEISAERRRERNGLALPKREPSTYIPRAVRREVMARDGFQCTFLGPEGNRCPERGRLQLDHFPVPSSCGGPATSDNLRVRCAAHNLLAAEQFFGRDRVLQEIAASRAGAAVSLDETARGPDRVAVSPHETVRGPDA